MEAPTRHWRRECLPTNFELKGPVQAGGFARESGRRRISDHCRELSFRGDLAVNGRSTGKLADSSSLLREFDFELQQNAGLDRLPELRAFDGHEVNELARVREPEGFDR